MANGNYSVLKDNIDDYIKQNGDGDITGQVLQTQLFAMITSLGSGYQFMGVAKLTPTPTDPGSPDQNVFYVAFQPGIYSNFGSQTVADGEIAILKWNGSWTKEVTGAASAAKLDELGQELDEKLLNNYIVGAGQSAIQKYIYGLVPGRKYRVVFKTPNWDLTGITISSGYSVFSIVNYYNNSASEIVSIPLDRNIPPTVDFEIPANSDYVRFGFRASAGTRVDFNVIDIDGFNSLYNSLVRYDSNLYIKDSDIAVAQSTLNKYVYLTGTIVSQSGLYINEYDVSDCDAIRASVSVYGGVVISIISGYDANGRFLYSFDRGTRASEEISYSRIIDCKALGISKITLSGDTQRIDTAKVEKLKFSPTDSVARAGVNSVNSIVDDVYTKKVPILEESTTSGAYVRVNGTINQNSGFSYKTYDVSSYKKVFAVATITGGSVVSVISGFDANDNFVQSFAAGDPGTARVERSADINVATLGIAKIRLSTTNGDLNTCAVYGYVPGYEKTISKVQTWGDSVTSAGQYQNGISAVLGIGSADIKNAGLASDFSMHVRRRCVSYFTDETPYVGTATYSVPSFAERQEELKNSFFVFWFGTNNLVNPARDAGPFTTGSAAYNALQPNPDFKFDRLYSRAYIDMMLEDIRQVVDLLPHKNFVIIGGHGGFMGESDMRTKMLELDKMLARMYPRNFVDVRELVNMDYNFQDVHLGADFAKPALNGSVNIVLNKTDWIGQNGNVSNDICVGTKTIYDKYHVVSIINSTTISAELIESNTEFVEGDTIRAEYLLVSDLGRDAVNMQTRVYSYEDCVTFGLMSFPRSSSDPIHFTNEQYYRIGQLIGYEILKMKLS